MATSNEKNTRIEETTVRDKYGKTADDYGQEWAAAKAAGKSQAELDAIHQKAEDVRALSGYSAGAAGNEDINLRKASEDTTRELEAVNNNLNTGAAAVRTGTTATTAKPKNSRVEETTVTDASGKTAADYGNEWATAKAAGASQAELDAIHAKAEAVRAQSGYSAGSDGSKDISIGRAAPDPSTLKPKVDVLAETTVRDAAGYTAADYGDMWAEAYLRGEPQEVLDELHRKAEAVRALSLYSGGGDGSEYIYLGQQDAPVDDVQYNIAWRQQDLYDTLDDKQASMDEKYTKLGNLLTEKANAEVDEATRQAINTLNATLEEYTTLYNQERSKAAYSQAQASDNMVLRNTAAGDMGGIGNKLYSDQQANYDAQITQIDLEQANLMSDTARQIADLVAQGEYNKAQNVLEIGIANLQNMINQENQFISWKMNLASNLDNLDFDKMQFDEGVREYNLSLALNKLQLGMFSADDAKALGVSPAQAQAYADRVNAMADYDLESAKASLESQALNNQAAKESSFYNKLERGMFNEADAIALGIDPSQAKEYANYINLLRQVDETEAQRALRELINGAGVSGGTGTRRNSGGGGGTPGSSSDITASDLLASGVYPESLTYNPLEVVGQTTDGNNNNIYTLDSGNQVVQAGIPTENDAIKVNPVAQTLSPRGQSTYQSILGSPDPFGYKAYETLNFAHANGAITDYDYSTMIQLLNLEDYLYGGR